MFQISVAWFTDSHVVDGTRLKCEISGEEAGFRKESAHLSSGNPLEAFAIETDIPALAGMLVCFSQVIGNRIWLFNQPRKHFNLILYS